MKQTPDITIKTQLASVRFADHEVAAMPKGPYRSRLQFLVAEKLEELYQLQVVNAEDPNVSVTSQKVFPRIRHRRALSETDDFAVAAEKLVETGPILFKEM